VGWSEGLSKMRIFRTFCAEIGTTLL